MGYESEVLIWKRLPRGCAVQHFSFPHRHHKQIISAQGPDYARIGFYMAGVSQLMVCYSRFSSVVGEARDRDSFIQATSKLILVTGVLLRREEKEY